VSIRRKRQEIPTTPSALGSPASKATPGPRPGPASAAYAEPKIAEEYLYVPDKPYARVPAWSEVETVIDLAATAADDPHALDRTTLESEGLPARIDGRRVGHRRRIPQPASHGCPRRDSRRVSSRRSVGLYPSTSRDRQHPTSTTREPPALISSANSRTPMPRRFRPSVRLRRATGAGPARDGSRARARCDYRPSPHPRSSFG
jgi:hypothetical protein